MGAALTYARRYALFTLVGIVGEDDLDAPDLNSGDQGAVETEVAAEHHTSIGASTKRSAVVGRSRKPQSLLPKILPPDESASVRARLLEQLSQIQSADDAASWARHSLPIKNTLAAPDAQSIETTFALTLSRFADGTPAAPPGEDTVESVPARGGVENTAQGTAQEPEGANNDDSISPPTVAPKVIRLRDKEHRQFVAHQPCVVCGRRPSDPHHLRFAQPRALSRKVSDEFVVPVCRLHHREIHRYGDEPAWWAKIGIDPMVLAHQLWRRTRKNNESRSFRLH
jgi:hypothetical protein